MSLVPFLLLCQVASVPPISKKFNSRPGRSWIHKLPETHVVQHLARSWLHHIFLMLSTVKCRHLHWQHCPLLYDKHLLDMIFFFPFLISAYNVNPMGYGHFSLCVTHICACKILKLQFFYKWKIWGSVPGHSSRSRPAVRITNHYVTAM